MESETTRIVITTLVIVFMVLPLIAVVVVSWIFLRAKRREDQALREQKEEQERTKWPNEPSS